MELPANIRNRYRSIWDFASGETRPESLPSTLQIALDNRCNFHCSYCPDHRANSTIPRTELAGAVREKTLALIPYVETLAFHGVSEFLIDRNFFDILEVCAASRARLSINTNGSVWSERHAEAFRSYPAMLDFNISVDAATAASYTRIRGWSYERLLVNIRRFAEVLRQRTAPTWSSLSFVIMRTNVGEMADFVRLAGEHGFRAVKFYRLHEYGSFSWQIESADGKPFDYRDECADRFPEEHDANVLAASAVAAELGLAIEVPALFRPAHGGAA